MFSGIVGFAKYCSENSDAEGAMKIVSMLNELYTAFDALTDPSRNPNIYKVGNHRSRTTQHEQRCLIRVSSTSSLVSISATNFRFSR